MQPPRRQRPPRKPERQPVAGAEARLAAADLLCAVEQGADLESAMAASAPLAKLTGSDRGFARAIAGAALRAQGRIDFALGGLLNQPLDKIEPPVRALLRAGCAQIWLMDVAEHAAVSATVEAARLWREARRGGGLVNAVLRRAIRERELFENAPPTSVWPDWLAARLKSGLGPQRADAMALAQLDEPSIDLTLKPGVDAADLAGMIGGEVLANGSVRMKAGLPLETLPGYVEGQWWVQDAAATLAARLLGDIANKSVFDLCAAPGGKALQLAAAGANVTALDISHQRLGTLRENLARTQLPMTVVEGDARTWKPEALADAILLDAPCSALGTLRRHPEGAWRREPQGLARYPAIQASLINVSADLLKPGGVLSYCVCTPLPEEGRDAVAAALATGRWKRLPLSSADVPGFGWAITPEGDLLTAAREGASATPDGQNAAGQIECDVFFLARLERTGP